MAITVKQKGELSEMQKEILIKLVPVYFVDENMRQSIISNIESYSDRDCEVLLEAISKVHETQNDFFAELEKEDPELAQKIADIPLQAIKEYHREMEKESQEEEALELSRIEDEINKN